jgi:hypothetical protein
MTIQTVLVPFHGESIMLFDVDGEPFVPLKPICQRLGLDWITQFKRLRMAQSRLGIVHMPIPSAGGTQETTCIPLRKLPAWLYSINVNKVAEEARAALIQYQAECDDVLWQHWSGQHKDEIATLRRQHTALKAMALASNPLLNRIRTYAEGGYRKSTVQILIGKSFDAAFNLFDMMQEAGLLPETAWTEALDRSAIHAEAKRQADLFQQATPEVEVQHG